MSVRVQPALDGILRRLQGVKGPDKNGWWTAFCPLHDDRKTPNLRFTNSGFQCMACGEKGSLARLAEAVDVELRANFDERIEQTYDYLDEDGRLLYQVVRLHSPKDFRQRRPDGNGGWIWKLDDTRRVLYRLPEVLSAPLDQVLFVVEGEKDADRLWAEGFAATTNPGGAGKWRRDYGEALRGRRVAVVADNDRAGIGHAETVARFLQGVAAEVKIITLPDVPEKGDITDWLDGGNSVEQLVKLVSEAPAPETGDSNEIERLPLTDAGNGELFSHLYGDRVRFDHRRKAWLVWGGHCWQMDRDSEVRRLAKLATRHRFLRATAIENLEERNKVVKFAIASENRQRLDAMLAQAQSEVPVADAGDAWNADPWLMAVANGVVDLRTGELRDGRPSDRITYQSPVAYDPQAECPRWLRFLDEVFRQDRDLIDFIRRAVGYSITAMTYEQCMFLCYGRGSNGKSVFLAVLRAAFGDYAYNAPFSLFELQQRSSIPNDVAAVAGRRLVTSSETNEGTRLNEARIKALTGCDTMSARFLHAEWFQFEPVAKYWLAANHRPVVKDDSDGFWRRVMLIPFLQKFTGDDIDPELEGRLRAELPGILAWAVRGAQEWQEHGLEPPSVVRQATEEYRIESDPLAQFTDERCVVGERFHVGAAELFKAYKAWAEEQGMRERETLTSTTFGKRMAARFEKRHTKSGKRYAGIGLVTGRQNDPEDDPAPDDPEVTGWVTGSESEDRKNDVSPKENGLTRENLQKPVTTRHPVTQNHFARCRGGCGRMVPAGQKCTECAATAVQAWKESGG